MGRYSSWVPARCLFSTQPTMRALIALVVLASCATVTPVGPAAQAAPLIDRELLFGDPEITGAQISPDGRFISFVKPFKGVLNVWVKAKAEPFEAARPLTADARPVRSYFWSRDGKYVLYSQDKGGDENFHVYAVDPTAAPDSVTGAPQAKDLTPGAKVRASVRSLPRATPDVLVIQTNERDPEANDVYRLVISTGARTMSFKNTTNLDGFTFDPQGKVRVVSKLNESGGTVISRVDGETSTQIYECAADEQCSVEALHPDGEHAYLSTNKGTVDLTRLTLLDLKTGAEVLVEEDPEKQVDFAGAIVSEHTDELLATVYLGDKVRLYPKTARFAQDYAAIRKVLPDVQLGFVSGTADEGSWLIEATADVDPGATYLYEHDSGKVELLFRSRPKLPVEQLAHMRPERITTRDGLTMTAYLTRPLGDDGNTLRPAIVLVHGGPWGRDLWGYDALAQFLANRGYVVLQPNFRASTGYGKRFLNLGNRQWGTGTMQHDLTDAAKWLVDQKLADPKRLAIMGGSYGGYATLAGLAFTPEIYAAGVDIVGPSNLTTLLNSIPPYWAPMRKMFSIRMGDLSVAADVERLKAQSPLFSADKISAPLLVIQGQNDPRVHRAESDQIVCALVAGGHPVGYLVAPDEGHGFRGRLNRLAMMVEIERFLAKHLGGRAQQSVSSEVAQKLQAITVDPASVVLQRTN